MATRTAFAIVSDSAGAWGQATYPDDGGSEWNRSGSSVVSQAEQRYAAIGLEGTTLSYPYFNDEGFNTPRVRFLFLNAFGERIPGAPFIQLRLPPNFNVTSFSDYSRTEGIFAGGADIYSSLFNATMKAKLDEASLGGAAETAINALGNAGVTGAEAIAYSLKKSIGSSVGFLAAGGLSNIGQYEFSQREAFNPMAQLLYKGPQVRRYQLPFAMRPKNKVDSDNIRKIINAFRVASAPSVPSTDGIFGSGSEASNIGQGNSFTFGYPHLTQFTIGFITPESTSKRLFRSKVCAIESVSVDYGGQKMTFFEDGSPTEMNLTLQLSEVMPRTLGDAFADSQNPEIRMG